MPARREIVVRCGARGFRGVGGRALSVQVKFYAPAAPYVSLKPDKERLLRCVSATFVHDFGFQVRTTRGSRWGVEIQRLRVTKGHPLARLVLTRFVQRET